MSDKAIRLNAIATSYDREPVWTNDFVIIGAGFPQSPGGILSLPSKPIRKASDINGKTMMVQDPSLAVILDGILTFAGKKPDYKVIITGFSADPLFSGDGDGYLCFVTSQPLELEAQGMRRDKDFVLASFLDLGLSLPECLMVVDRKFLARNRGELVDFLEVLLRGWQRSDADSDGVIGYIVDRYGQDYGLQLEVEKRKAPLTSALTYPQGGKERFVIETTQIDQMYELAKLTKRPTPSSQKLFDLSLLQEAQARLQRG